MSAHDLKSILLFAHRWVALILAPLFVLIILSGAVLAVKPILEAVPAADSGAGPVPVDTTALVGLLDRVDPDGAARMAVIGDDGRTLVLAKAGGVRDAYDLATGAIISAPQQGSDFFGLVKRFHEDLLLEAGLLVEIATWAMTLLIIVGPVLAWPRLNRTLAGWHRGIGWVLFPLVLLTPLTAVLMILHIGGPARPQLPPSAAPASIARALEQAAPAADLSALVWARRMGNGVMLLTGTPDGRAAFLVGGGAVAPMEGGPGLIHELHEGTWAGGWSGLVNLLASFALLGLTVTGVLPWVRRWRQARRRTGGADADILVAFASQTGRAARLAEATAAALTAGGGKVSCAAMAALAPEELKHFRQVLLVVSTTGEGEVPDQGRTFLNRLRGTDLKGVPFALVALGDSRYPDYCAGGIAVRDALLAAGAVEVVGMACVDGEATGPWQDWLAAVGARIGVDTGSVAAPEADRPVTLTLVSRQQLNDPGDPDTHEAWSLLFQADGPLDYRSGDLLMVAPGPGEPPRPYSVSAAPGHGPERLLLTVGLTWRREADGSESLGKASGLLCRGLRPGDRLDAALRRHPAFNPPPPEADRPMILLCAGCGIAPFIGFLAEREETGARQPVWLVFGNRKRKADFFYGDLLEGWMRRGVLARLDTAFSREPEGGYAPDRLIEAGAELLAWMDEKGAVLYACGRASTLGAGLDRALHTILAQHRGMDADAATRQIARWDAEGRLRRDLFD